MDWSKTPDYPIIQFTNDNKILAKRGGKVVYLTSTKGTTFADNVVNLMSDIKTDDKVQNIIKLATKLETLQDSINRKLQVQYDIINTTKSRDIDSRDLRKIASYIQTLTDETKKKTKAYFEIKKLKKYIIFNDINLNQDVVNKIENIVVNKDDKELEDIGSDEETEDVDDGEDIGSDEETEDVDDGEDIGGDEETEDVDNNKNNNQDEKKMKSIIVHI